jgi:hypothetical protein
MSPYPGEVWLADLGMAAKTRPVVIVSRHDEDAPRALPDSVLKEIRVAVAFVLELI